MNTLTKRAGYYGEFGGQFIPEILRPAIVELDEGPHLLTNIVGCGPDKVKCDMPVEVIWDDISEEFSLPKFKPAP